MSQRIKKANRRYTIEMLGAMLLYAGVLIGAKLMARDVESDVGLVALSLAPILPLGLAAVAFFRLYFNMDERDRRISADAAALTLLIGIFTAATLGFLRAFEVLAFDDEMMWFCPYLIMLWGVMRIVLGGRGC